MKMKTITALVLAASCLAFVLPSYARSPERSGNQFFIGKSVFAAEVANYLSEKIQEDIDQLTADQKALNQILKAPRVGGKRSEYVEEDNTGYIIMKPFYCQPTISMFEKYCSPIK